MTLAQHDSDIYSQYYHSDYFQSPRLKDADIPLLNDLLNNVKTTKWYHLGLQLDISSYDLDIIEHDSCGVEDRLRRMLQKWLKSCEKPSWGIIVNALKSIDEKVLANKLEEKFCLQC